MTEVEDIKVVEELIVPVPSGTLDDIDEDDIDEEVTTAEETEEDINPTLDDGGMIAVEVTDGVEEDITDGVEEDITDGVEEDITDGVEEDITDGVEEDITDGVKEDITNGVEVDVTTTEDDEITPLDVVLEDELETVDGGATPTKTAAHTTLLLVAMLTADLK